MSAHYPREDDCDKNAASKVSAKQHHFVVPQKREEEQFVEQRRQRARYEPTAIGIPEGSESCAIFLGPGNHSPMLMLCPRCGFEGVTECERKSGTANVMAAIITFGISLLACPIKDTYHFCSQCQALVGVSKVA
jgi:hypothetical protein